MRVRHARGEYPIQFGTLRELAPSGCFVVTDANVDKYWGHAVPAGTPKLVVPPGETSKSMAVFDQVVRWLASSGARRDSTLLALGGGVIGDLAGFAAASYMRGIALVQAPTSLLAMVDSSVGGKVGIDLPEGKNLVGAFWPPQAVAVDVRTLATLPDRELANGAAEVWKYGAILDAALWEELEREPIEKGRSGMEQIVARCIELKAAVVDEDEFETSGRRAILNFGHTIAHAVEAALGYAGLLHGEAVAVGMVVEARLGERLGATAPGTAERIAAGMARQGLPVALPKLDPAVLLGYMRSDKKADRSGLAFSLLTKLGECTLVRGVEEKVVLEVLAQA